MGTLWELRQGSSYQASRSLVHTRRAMPFPAAIVRTLLIAPQFPQRLDGARPEASGVARPTLAPSLFSRPSTPAKLVTPHFTKTFPCRCTHVPQAISGASRRSPRRAKQHLISLEQTGWTIAAGTAMAWVIIDIVIFVHHHPVVDLSSFRKPLPTPQKG